MYRGDWGWSVHCSTSLLPGPPFRSGLWCCGYSQGALAELVDIVGVYLHIIIYTRARGRLCQCRAVVVEVLLGMGGVGQYLVVAAMDIDVNGRWPLLRLGIIQAILASALAAPSVDRGLFVCHFCRIFMVVRPGVVWTYVQRVYGRTSLGGKDVRAEVAWTYVQRTFERWRTEVNEMCVDSTDSE